MKNKLFMKLLLIVLILNCNFLFGNTIANNKHSNSLGNKFIQKTSYKECDYCAKRFNLNNGFIMAAEIGCANSYSHFAFLKRIGAESVKNGKMTKSDYIKWLKAYEYSRFYCSRKCVNESGISICIGS